MVRCATELMTEQGFSATGIDEVLKRVGVPKGSFYYYFASKQAFGEAVIANYDAYFARKLDRILNDASLSPVDRLRAFVADAKAGMARYQFRRGCLVGNLGQELGSMNDTFRHQLEAVLQSWQMKFETCLKEAIVEGQLPTKTDAKGLAEFFWIGWEGAILRAKLTRNADPLDQFADVFFNKVLALPASGSKRRPKG